MELKVWVEGAVRVVCGISLTTSCQDVVIALAQAIGQTGRYILIMKLWGTERQLVADDCPLQHLAQLGQLAAEVQLILRRTGPSLSDGSVRPTSERYHPLPPPPEPEALKHREPQKALTFNLGPSMSPRRSKRAWSRSPRASPEPRASPVPFLDPQNPVKAIPPPSSKEEVFRQVLLQQRRLQELEIQLQDLEKETGVWEQENTSAALPDQNVVSAEELEELEQRLRHNEAELMHWKHWEEELQAEMDREGDTHASLQQIRSSIDDHSYQLKVLRDRSAYLEQDIQLRAGRQSCQEDTRQLENVLRPLKKELHHRLQQGEHLGATLSWTKTELQAVEERLQSRWEIIEELNKELRQWKLQQFIQQTAVAPHGDQANRPTVPEVVLSNAGIMD
ncbi:ras association domain-containing protein 7-like isoform 1-T2 [Aulostomus maculatus]